MKLVIYTDGGARGNPGPAGIGVVVCDEVGRPSKKYSEYLGEKTNNEAEYEAVIFALKKIKSLLGKKKVKETKIELRTDSELVVNQLNHKYKIEEAHLQKLFIKIWNTLIDFGEVKFSHVPREENKEADRLVNEALEAQNGEQSLL